MLPIKRHTLKVRFGAYYGRSAALARGSSRPVTSCSRESIESGEPAYSEPYLKRKVRLERIFKPAPPGILYYGHFESDGQFLYDGAVLPLELEGLVAERTDSAYQAGQRSPDWVKVKRPGAVLAERFKK